MGTAEMTLPKKRSKPRRTTSPRCRKQRCNKRAEIDDLCVTHADDEAWHLFSKYIRDRDARCTAAGVLESFMGGCEGGLQAAHIVGRTNQRVRYDPLNVHALCMAHHMTVDQSGREHAKYAWAVAVLGEDGYEDLMARARPRLDRREAIRAALEQLKPEVV
jgi:hypothetical protein